MQRQVVEFSKYNPSRNMTILVHSKHQPSEYAAIAHQLMATTHMCCEQVGFIESVNYENGDNYHLVMSGNEFCGNATMSYIHYLKERLLIQHQQFQLRVSGCSHPVECKVHSQHYEVTMPKVHQVKERFVKLGEQQFKAFEISYDTYIHYVMMCDDVDLAIKQCVEDFVSAQTWHRQFKTIGVMLFQQDKQFIYPLIHIPAIDSLIWENSCGSGAASIGVLVNYLTDHDIQDYLVNQPGGSIIVSSRKSGQNEYQTTIKGQVSTVATGQAYIEQETMTQI